MTPQEHRIALAEWDGWTLWKVPSWAASRGTICVRGAKKWSNIQHFPDYLNDLNAMHELEVKYIESADPMQITRYESSLRRIGRFRSTFASASERAEALLKTIGKWKD